MKKKSKSKNLLKYAGLCSLVLGAIAFILMMVTPAISVSALGATVNFSGNEVIFGSSNLSLAQAGVIGSATAKPAVLALIGWILALAGLVIVLLGVIMPLFNVKGFTKFAGLLNFIAVGCLVVAGVFMFIVLPAFYTANGFESVPGNASIGAGWVIGGIIFIVAGAIAILPAAVDFISKK